MELLFRGQTRRKGEKVRLNGEPVSSNWVYGGVFPGGGDFSVIYQNEPEVEKFMVYTDTVGQFTGVSLNGKKVFFGDILTDGKRYVLVQWNKRNLQWCAVDQKTGWTVRLMCIVEDVKHQWRICGNQWDNPELVKVKKGIVLTIQKGDNNEQ